MPDPLAMPDSPIQAETVFEILVRENAGMLTTYLRAVVWDPAVVDDLFQDTMLVAWRRLSPSEARTIQPVSTRSGHRRPWRVRSAARTR